MKNCIYFDILFFLLSLISTKIQFNFTIIEEEKYIYSEENGMEKKRTPYNIKSFIEAPIGSDPDSKTLMTLCLGSPSQCFNLIILTNSFYVMVSNINSQYQDSKNTFNISNSNTLSLHSHYIELDYYGEKIVGQEALDKLTINGQKMSFIKFLLLNSSGKYRNADGFVGFGYMPSKEEREFSLIQQLFEKGKIPHKVFSQYYYDNYNGVITLGEIPDYIVEDYIHYGRCKALNKIKKGIEYKNNNWECNIDFLYYGNNVNDMYNMIEFTDDEYKQEVLFLSYRKRSYLPLFIFDIFGQTYFREALYEKKCSLYHGGKYRWYECDKNVKLPILNLVFDAWEIRIPSDKLFVPSKFNKNKNEFIFYYKEKFEKFLIGRSLLKEFEMVYDYANKEIGFYYPTVRYLGNEKIGPPKVYTFLEDDEEYNEKILNNSENFLPDAKPEEISNENNAFGEIRRIYLADIFKIIFEIFIIIIVIGLFGFFIIYGLRIRKKSIIKKTNIYLKNQRLIEMH